jgi:hypothetical protein
MKRLTASIVIGIAAGMLSIPLALLPNVFNPVESSAFNHNLRLTWFLGCSLQGLLASGLLVVSWQKAHPTLSVHRVLHTWGLTALLGVAIPAPCILNGKYADGLCGCYALLVGIAAIMFVLTGWARPQTHGLE